MCPSEHRWGPGHRVSVSLIVLAALSLLVAFVPAPARADRPHGAGLVIRHGDGKIVYAYVEFSESEITGDQLLARSHLPLVVQDFGGLGLAVCSLDGEGCPATNCFCKSYQSPSVYWHYYSLNTDGTWSIVSLGPSSHMIHDGDVDGWSWTGSASGLPRTSIDAIAKLNGVDRSVGSAAPSPTPTPAATTVPAPTPRPPTPTPTVASTATAPTFAPTARPPTPTLAPTIAPTSPALALVATPATPPAPMAAASPPGATPETTPVARAVEVDPNGGARPLTLATQTGATGPPAAAYVAFATILAVLAALCGWLMVRRRPDDGP